MELQAKSFLVIIFVLLIGILGVQQALAEMLPESPPGDGGPRLHCLGPCPPDLPEGSQRTTLAPITGQPEVTAPVSTVNQEVIQEPLGVATSEQKNEQHGFIQQLRDQLNSLLALLRQSFGGTTTPKAFAPNGALSQYMDKLVAEDTFSGTVLIAKDGVPLFEKAYGMANKTQSIPNNVNTKFNVGSMSKMFTGIAIAQLAEQGKLSFDDPIGKYLPELPAEIGNKVTIHHLLTHTSGMGDFLRDPQYRSKVNTISTVQEMMPFVVNQPLRFEPGSRHEYSNSGFLTLGAIIEKVSGQDYYSYINAHITQPSGMIGTGFYETDDAIPNLAHGYMGTVAVKRDNAAELPLKGNPSGGGYSTGKDMLRFSKALLRNKLLRKEYTDIVMTGKVASPIGQYAYGFEDLQENGQRIVGHSGGFPGVSAYFRIFMNNGYTVIILSNYDEGAREPYREIVQTLSQL